MRVPFRVLFFGKGFNMGVEELVMLILLMPKILHDLHHRTYLMLSISPPPSISMLHPHGVMQYLGRSGSRGAVGRFTVMQDLGQQP